MLRGLPNVILTPHVGGSTQEAQEEIGWFVAGKLAGFVLAGPHRAVGRPARRDGPALETGARIGFLHVNVPGVLAEVNQVLADQGSNVTGQYLATRGEQGYVVTDVETLSPDALAKLRGLAAHGLAAHLDRLGLSRARPRGLLDPAPRGARRRPPAPGPRPSTTPCSTRTGPGPKNCGR